MHACAGRKLSPFTSFSSPPFRFDWVLILAGINDIGWAEKSEAVFHSLRRMYRVGAPATSIAQHATRGLRAGHRPASPVSHSLVRSLLQASTEHGARVLVMTNSENRGSTIKPATEIEQARQRLNILIREYAMKNRGPGGALLVDLESLMPYRMHDDSSRWFDSDGLHLTTHGYDMLARLLHAHLKLEFQKRQLAIG